MPNYRRTTRVLALAFLVGLALPAGRVTAANGQSQLDAANKLVAAPVGNVPAEPILFPAVIAMTPAPAILTDWRTAALLTTKSPDWPAVEKWATAEPQQKALEALAKVTDTKTKTVIALPYTTKGVDEAWVKAGLVIDTGAEGVLAGAKYKYLEALKPLGLLAAVEGERLAAAGEGAKASKLMLGVIRLGRLYADRPTITEKVTGIRIMQDGCERLRDLVYLHPDAFKVEDLKEAVLELDERLIAVMKIRLPDATRLAAEQLIELTIKERGEVDAGKLGATMSRLSSLDRPLTRFSEAAKWKKVANVHAGWFDTQDELKKVWGDWTTRWNLADLHDPLLRKATDYQKMPRGKFAILEETVAGVDLMRDRRLRLLTEMSGTRGALAVAALAKRSKALPPALQAVVPDFARREYLVDSYAYDRRFRTLGQLQYFVPIRDQKFGPRELPHPHAVTVVVGDGEVTPIASGDLADMVIDFGESLLALKELAKSGNLAALPEAAKKLPITERDRANYAQLLIVMNQNISGGQNVADIFKQEIMATPAGQIRSIARKLQLSPEDVKSYAADVFGALYASQTIENARKTISGGTITEDTARQVRDEIIALSMRQETLEKYITKPPVSAASESTAGGMTNSFTVELDDKVFVLYSVGSDALDNKARNVGDGGDDILYWPPLISLYREHLK